MTTVWLGETRNAIEGDYVLRPLDDGFEVGQVEDGEVYWLDPVTTTTEGTMR